MITSLDNDPAIHCGDFSTYFCFNDSRKKSGWSAKLVILCCINHKLLTSLFEIYVSDYVSTNLPGIVNFHKNLTFI